MVRMVSIKMDNDTKTIECYTQENLLGMKIGDTVQVTGFLQLHSNDTGRIYLMCEMICLINESEKIAARQKMYCKLQQALSHEKRRTAIKQFINRPLPLYVKKVGLIVPVASGNPSITVKYETQLQNFKLLFREMCCGTLYVYQLENDLDLSLRGAMEYFKKYHNIDLVCLLTNQLNQKQILEISSTENVKYFFRRKNYPYVVSIISNCPNQLMMEPLTAFLSNLKVNSIYDCVHL